MLKVDVWRKLNSYKDLGITTVVIEEPLLNSNNVWTVGTLLRYNSMISRSIYNILGVVQNTSPHITRKFSCYLI